MDVPDIRTANVKNKRVFLRMDLDAPLSESRIVVADDTRLVVGMPTLEYLLSHGATVVVGGHLRRPEDYDPKLSVKPVVEWIFEKIKNQKLKIENEDGRWEIKNEKLGGFEGWKLSEKLFILENLRFYKEEKANDLEFAKRLASLADIYVNDAFASSHRNHASIVGIPKFLPHFAGLHIQKEIEVLASVLENPQRPLAVIIGGEKIETKLPLVSKMCSLAEYVLIGGKIAQEISDTHKNETVPLRCALLVAKVNDTGTDMIEKSIEEFLEIIKIAKTIVWNGPVGFVEDPTGEGRKGSEVLAKAISESGAHTIVGGGDTLEFLKEINLLNKFSFFSTGGGAMLSFLSGEKLPGLEALLKV